MNTRRIIALKRLLAVSLFAVTLSALAADYQWPQRGDDPYPWPKGKDADKILHDRFTKASKKVFGTDADVAAIKSAIIKHMKIDKAAVSEIRWLSPSLVMASAGWYHGPRASADYYYVVEKKDENWRVLTYYMLSIS